MSIAQFNSSPEGLKALNERLLTRSFCDEDGFSPSQTDTAVFRKLNAGVDGEKYPNVARWYRNVASYGTDIESFPGEAVDEEEVAVPAKAAASKDSDSDSDSESDDDFVIEESSDDEEVDPASLNEADKERKRKQAEKDAMKKANAKSTVVFYIKPLEVDVDKDITKKAQAELEQKVREIEMDGLKWQGGPAKFVAVTQYIWKMQFGCIIFDAKVSVDLLEEMILNVGDGELVQSTDIADFQKV